MNITYVNEISAHEVNCLRSSIGFRKINLEQLNASLAGSAYIVAAYSKEEVIGMSRLIWDGGSVALIHDIIVVPQYQMQGIEAEMLNRIFVFLKSKLKPGFGIQVDIRAWNNQVEYFESVGFQISTTQKRGVPMHICLTNQIELTDNMSE